MLLSTALQNPVRLDVGFISDLYTFMCRKSRKYGLNAVIPRYALMAWKMEFYLYHSFTMINLVLLYLYLLHYTLAVKKKFFSRLLVKTETSEINNNTAFSSYTIVIKAAFALLFKY